MRRHSAVPVLLLAAALAPAAEIPLSGLDLTTVKQGWKEARIDQSVDGLPLSIAKKPYKTGVGTHAESEMWLALDGKATRFTAEVGVDDAVAAGQATFGTMEFVVAEGDRILWRSGVMRAGDQARRIDLPLTGVKSLLLYVGDASDGTAGDHADWADARIAYGGAKPVAIAAPDKAKRPSALKAVTLQYFLKGVPAGYTATLFAQPPDVSYPTQVCAAPDGAVFVAIDKNGSLDKQPHRGSIIRATDRDGDGVADRFDTFVADVDTPRGLYFDGTTLYCLHPPTLTAYRDTDGDGKADWQRDIATGVGYGFDLHPGDHTSNGIRMGIDGWLYMAIGDFGIPDGKGTKDGSSVVMRGGGVLRVRPDGSELEVYANHTRNIYDVALDPYLNGFIRDNTNDGDGWNSRLSYLVGTADYGYPSLYKRFADDLLPPLADYGGGSAVGSLFLHEPGFPGDDGNALLTCDWGTSAIYRHPLTPDGAGWSAKQEVFAKIDRVVDVDVDGSSRLYAASWKGAQFTYNGERVGALIRLAPDGAKPAPFPVLAKATDADLMQVHLASRSAVCRQQSQSEILRRGAKPAFKTGLTALATTATAPLYVRVAAIFTYEQLYGAEARDLLLRLAQDASVQEWALRALADRKPLAAAVPVAPFVTGLASPDPRVRVQALIGLVRIGDPSVAASIVPLTAVTPAAQGPQRIIPHLAVHALATFKAVDPCLAAIVPGAPPAVVDGALWALRLMHERKAVDGLIAKLATADGDLRAKLLTALIQLHDREGTWNRTDWWRTRPEHEGPYFQRETWESTPAIETALKAAAAKGADAAAFIAQQLAFYRVEIAGLSVATATAAATGPSDAEVLAKAQAATKQAAASAGGAVIAKLGYEDIIAGATAAKGDPQKGKQRFLMQGCVACHTLTRGPQKGPYLGEIAKQYGRGELIEAIVKPNEKIAQGFATVWFELKDGQRKTGFIVSEGAEVIQLRDIGGHVSEIRAADIAKRGENEKSMMPEGLVNNLTPAELADLLAFFESLVNK